MDCLIEYSAEESLADALGYASRYRNPKRQRGIVLLTIRTEDLRPRHDAESGDEVDCLVEYSAEESLADACALRLCVFHNPKRKRGIVLLTIRTEDLRPRP